MAVLMEEGNLLVNLAKQSLTLPWLKQREKDPIPTLQEPDSKLVSGTGFDDIPGQTGPTGRMAVTCQGAIMPHLLSFTHGTTPCRGRPAVSGQAPSAFLHVNKREQSAFGSLHEVTFPSAKREVSRKGTFSIGSSQYKRMNLWSMEEHFDRRPLVMPPMRNPWNGTTIDTGQFQVGSFAH